MNRDKYRWSGTDLLHKLADLPHELWHWFKGKAHSVQHEEPLLAAAHRIELNRPSLDALKRRYAWKLSLAGKDWAASAEAWDEAAVSPWERQLTARLAAERDAHNRNNLTRTTAYLRMYREHPELHWAFLAHMVSRNGGWSMTDLRGEFLPYLLSEDQREWVFRFLERANALIFRDAYPQLLLYEASLRHRRPLFHLLPAFGVSRFMRPLWEHFWERRESALLTVGLIINEQQHIEERVVRNASFLQQVVDTFFFQAQSLLQLNQVVFPYRYAADCRLAGLILESFSSLRERIEVGKSLYAILFGIPAVHEGAVRFACERRHTGSRADYWPQLFASVRHGPPVKRGQLQEKLDGLRLKPGAAPLYSPGLAEAWPDRPIAPTEPGDWFTDIAVLGYLSSIPAPFSFEMTQANGFGLKKIEMTVLAGDLLV